MVYKYINLEDTLCAWLKHTFSDDAYYFINVTGKVATQNASKDRNKEFSYIPYTYVSLPYKMNKYSIIIF